MPCLPNGSAVGQEDSDVEGHWVDASVGRWVEGEQVNHCLG